MHNWCLEIWGYYACFTRPEMKVERVSYDVITPSAARAIYEAILWKPAMRWNITKIEVLNPIKWVSVRRNEVGKTIPNPTAKQLSGESNIPMGIYIEDERQQRAGLFLKDVRYRIHGYFDYIPPKYRVENSFVSSRASGKQHKSNGTGLNDETEAKYAAMFERRAKKGQCFHRPYLGCREFACYFRLIEKGEKLASPIDETRDLGFMLYDMDFQKSIVDPPPMFFRAYMNKGIINTDRREVEVRG